MFLRLHVSLGFGIRSGLERRRPPSHPGLANRGDDSGPTGGKHPCGLLYHTLSPLINNTRFRGEITTICLEIALKLRRTGPREAAKIVTTCVRTARLVTTSNRII